MSNDSKTQTLPRPSGDNSNYINLNNNNGEVHRSRPVSLYDNLRNNNSNSNNNGTSGLHSNGQNISGINSNLNTNHSASEQNLSSSKKQTNFTNVEDDPEFEKCGFDRSPSQAIYLSTTVPQNMAANAISGRHTPTRNSLRHSRMIVMSRGGKVPRKYLPPLLRPSRLATALAALQLFTGIAVSILSLWLLLWAPNADTRHNPYWSGLTLAISGGLGLLLLGCCRKEYPGMPKENCVAAFKLISVLASLLAALLCFTACLYAVLHLFTLSGMTCEPENVLNATCKCRPTLTQDTNQKLQLNEINAKKNHSLSSTKSHDFSTTERHQSLEGTLYWHHFKDLNCPEVEGTWKILLIVSSLLNGVGVVVCFVYIYLFWASRKDYLYAKVRTRDNKNIVIHQANT